MVCFVSSVRVLAPDLPASGLDVVMVGVEGLGQASLALDLLEFHTEYTDMRALNIHQVREASALGALLLDAEQGLARFRRALHMLRAASNGVRSAAGNLRRNASRTVRLLARDALQISLAGAIGCDAQLHEIDDHLIAVRAAQGAAELLAEMDRALVFLRRANRRLGRDLDRLDAISERLRDLVVQGQGQGCLANALTRSSPAIAAIATAFRTFLRSFLFTARGYNNAGNYIDLLRLVGRRRRHLRATAARWFTFDYRRFSGPLQVRSRQDLAAVSALSRPRADEGRRVVVVIQGVNALHEARDIGQLIDTGVDESGWRVHGLTSLATLHDILHRIDLLDGVLTRMLHDDNVMDNHGAVHAPEFFLAADLHASKIQLILEQDPTVAIPEVSLLAHDVRDFVFKSKGPADVKNPLRTAVHSCSRVIPYVRGVQVDFVAVAGP